MPTAAVAREITANPGMSEITAARIVKTRSIVEEMERRGKRPDWYVPRSYK